MDAHDPSLHSPLVPRSTVIAARWYRAIAHSTFSPLPAAELRDQLAVLTDRAISLLHSDALDEQAAREIGARLAGMHLLHPEVLRQTLIVLSTELIADIPPARSAAQQRRLTNLLSAVAAGYLERAQATILREQETLRTALLTERERTAATLRASEARFRAIFSGAAIGIVLADLAGRPIEANLTIERMLGYTSDELRGMVFTAVTHPDDVSADWEFFAELVAGRRDAYQMQKRYLHKDSHVVWGNLTVSLVRDARGTPQFTIGMVEDISARMEMEATLMEAQRRLAESREVERLRLARELHDTAIQHLLDINRHLAEIRKQAGERDAATVPIVTVGAVQQQVREITAQLRDLVRDLRPPGLEEFGLSAALDGYMADLQQTRPDMPTVVLDMEGDDTTVPIAVSLPLFRAAQEAMRNVLEHAHARHVTLSLRVDAENAVLSVRDDGVGLAVPASLDTLARAGHFGLVGIAERVALAGGEMTVAAQPGEGTVITIRIPLAAQGGGDGDDSGLDRG